MASDDDFFVARKFGNLSVPVALYLQGQIVQDESRLKAEDDMCRRAADEDADSGTFRHDRRAERRKILKTLALKLGEYRRINDPLLPKKRALVLLILK